MTSYMYTAYIVPIYVQYLTFIMSTSIQVYKIEQMYAILIITSSPGLVLANPASLCL